MTESEYQRNFVEVFPSDLAHLPWLRDSIFFREVPLRHELGKLKPSKDLFMPDTKADFIELDAKGRLHLWEAKLLWADDFQKGMVVGQLLFYDWLFRTDESKSWLNLKPCNLTTSEVRSRLERAECRFHSWNILVCGGDGWELAAGVNPNAWTYTALNDEYLRDDSPALAVYHLFHTKSGFAIRNLWQLSVDDPQHMHPDSLGAYLAAGYGHSAGDGDREKLPHDLMLKFIGRGA
jgi:hypothetical protein